MWKRAVLLVGVGLLAACAPVASTPAAAPPTPAVPPVATPPAVTPPAATPPAATPGGTVPGGLPTHFGIGLAADTNDLDASTSPPGWVPATGIPFDYTYQYLAAGVDTGAGWQTWNAQAKFPIFYAQAAHARGAIPVFPYYMLFQSHGPTCPGCGEAQHDLTNLSDATTMSAYYSDFATLMQRLGAGTYGGVTGYGGTAIVHVEPDLSGYAQQAVLAPGANCYTFCTGTGNDASLLKASVASSGNADVAGYANTWRGFNLALLHLRDLYAPNVKLAFHVSDWATGPDIGSDSSTSLNATTQGNLAAAFANTSGVASVSPGTSTYDLLFNDVANADAGHAKYHDGQTVGAFWDRTNATVPSFTRWEQYVHAIASTTGKRIVVWQVPLGNQYFRTMNNTDGHYQDNRAEYFFGHTTELVSAGVVAVLYGRGTSGSTTNTDDKGDGITNPAPVCTGDGLPTGTTCPAHPATVADDDGGYLRMAASAYYASPVTLP